MGARASPSEDLIVPPMTLVAQSGNMRNHPERAEASTANVLWLPLPPLRTRRLPRRPDDLVLSPHPHRLRHRSLELRIMSGNNVFRPILDIDIWRGPDILDIPLAIPRKESTSRRNQVRNAQRSN